MLRAARVLLFFNVYSRPIRYVQKLLSQSAIMAKMNSTDIRRILSLPLSKKIDQKFVEQWASSFWGVAKCHRDNSTSKPFVMMHPPPNITGNLHLGHALTAALQDALIRHRQMIGIKSIWIPGFDHAGLSTQNIVERQLWNKEQKTRQQVGRSRFLEMANHWKELKQKDMRGQLDRLGLALNHEKEYFTMDEKSSLAVRTAFKRLFKSGIIYRAEKPVFWSEQLQSTLSDIEIEKVDGQDRYFRTGEIVTKRPVSQWFIDANNLAYRAVEVVENASIDIIPPNYKRSWSSWLIKNGVQDWCISRQSWWGHRVPAYKLDSAEDKQESWIVADNDEEAKEKLGSTASFSQDPDVLDTWFSSSLLPLTVSGWPDEQKFTESCKGGLFPFDIMETGFDILTYWVSKMVMMSLALENQIPFKLILLHGMICDSNGKKMSKSKGNVIDPLDVIDGTSLKEMKNRSIELKTQGLIESSQLDFVLQNQQQLFPNGIPACGADGLRAYLLSHDVQEEVVRVQIGQIEKVRRLSNKIWNVYRFILPYIETSNKINPKVSDLATLNLCELDRQVLDELSKCVYAANQSFNETYQVQSTFNKLELFWTISLSGDYIENIKNILFNRDEHKTEYEVKLQVLIKCLDTATKLLHPFMPHMTEYLYQKLCLSLSKNESEDQELASMSLAEFPDYIEWELLKHI